MNTTTRGLLACTVLCALIVALSGVARAGGVTRYEQKTNTISVNGGRQGTVSATCSAGNVVLSGGFSVTSPTLEIASSLPSAATAGWTVTVNNAGRLAQSVTVTATCVASSSVSGYEQPSSTISVNPSSSANVNVACSAGNVIVGGGYSVADPTVVGVSHSEPSLSSNLSNTNWDVAASNSSSTVAENVTAQGICVSSAISNYEEVPAQQSLGPSCSATLTASCSPGNEVLGGSFQVETTTFVSVSCRSTLIVECVERSRREQRFGRPLDQHRRDLCRAPPGGDRGQPLLGAGCRGHQGHDHRDRVHGRDRGQVRRYRRVVVHGQQRHPDHRDRACRHRGNRRHHHHHARRHQPDRRRRPLHLCPRADDQRGQPHLGSAVRRDQRDDHRDRVHGRDRGQVRRYRRVVVHGQQRDRGSPRPRLPAPREPSTSPSPRPAAPARPASPTTTPMSPRRRSARSAPPRVRCPAGPA